jgi:hypothetical protein
MQIKKTLVGLAAQNYAGKSGLADRLAFHHMMHYSVREKSILPRYHMLHGHEIEKIGNALTTFCEAQKKEHGCQIFIEEWIDRFVTLEESNICVLESLRAPGEARWFMEEMPKKYPGLKVLLIGITAPYEQRLARALRGRRDELGKQTKESFEAREKLVNRGIEPWEENVEAVLSLPYVQTFQNADGEFEETALQMRRYIESQAA